LASNPRENGTDNTHSFIHISKGTAVSHYRIIDRIGSGGMGEVYLAEDTELGREVALKFLPPHLCQDEECRQRFKREAQAAAGLDHPNVAAIYEVGEHKGRPFYAMQLVEGQSLREVVAGKELQIHKILEISIQVCEGLQAAHDKGIIHRDIKPSNILIDSHGRARIVDFGLASVAGREHLTRSGSTLGTIGYMSPEQVQGGEVDHRSDLFSLGVVLYEMITGQNPFKRDSEAATLKAVSDDTPHPVARYRADVPDGLQTVIDKALEKSVDTRYQHADGLMSDLMRVKRSLESEIFVVSPAPQARGPSRAKWIAGALVAIAAVVALILTKPWTTKKVSRESDKIMLAVLPFENLGSDEDEYFADGITDEIISRLAALHGLGVISRTSIIQYKGTDKNLREIGSELGVRYILEGTIRWDKSGEAGRVRINPQLIRVADDVHMWADRYDAVINDIFTVQSDIAEKVATALDINLLESERQALAERPTENTEAYDYYLKGRELTSGDEEDLREAEKMLNKAVELEPDFALGHATICFVHVQMYWWYYDRSEQRLKAAKDAIDRALEIAPDNPTVRGYLGWYYYHCHLDYGRALEEFTFIREKQPANARIIYCIALIERRQGKWEDAVENFRTAFKLNPNSESTCWEFAGTLEYLRRYEEAEDFYDRVIELDPDDESGYGSKAALQIRWKGDIDAARRILQEALRRMDRKPALTRYEIDLDIMAGDFDHALDLLTGPAVIGGNTAVDSTDYYNLKGDIYRHMEWTDLMEQSYDSARVILERMVKEDFDEPPYHVYLGWAYAGLGRKEEAVREGQLAIELAPVTKDAVFGAWYIENLANTYAILGEYDLAIDQLEYLLSIPSDISVNYVRVRPDYAPLRDHPRFQALLEKYGVEDQT
jgi:TolB-like protein/Tfp pilus assembly protein PilF/predicted Ser/Thr protein kinase